MVPPLTTNVTPDPPSSTSSDDATNAASAAGLAVNAEMIAVTISRTSPRSSSVKLVSRSNATEEGAADDRDGEQQLEARLGDELDDDQLPVGGREQRAALERSFEPRNLGHRWNGRRREGENVSIASGERLWRFERDGILRSGAFDFPQTDHAHPARQHGPDRRRG